MVLPVQVLESGKETQVWLPVLEHLISDCLPEQAGFLGKVVSRFNRVASVC